MTRRAEDNPDYIRRRAVSSLTLAGLCAGDARASRGRAGEISQLSAATAEGLLRGYIRFRGGKQPIPQAMIRRAYFGWARGQGIALPAAVAPQAEPTGWLGHQPFMLERSPRGNTTRTALAEADVERLQATNTSKGSACVPRAAACGVVHPGTFGVTEPRQLIARAAESAAITHGHSAAQAAAGALACILYFIADGTRLPGAVLRAAEIIRWDQDAVTDDDANTAVALNLEKAVSRAEGDGTYSSATQFGWKGHVAEEALGIAVWAALAGDLEKVLALAGDHGGERHATQATAGALWGAEAGLDYAEAVGDGLDLDDDLPQPLDGIPKELRPPAGQLAVMEWVAEDLNRICRHNSVITPADRGRWPGW